MADAADEKEQEAPIGPVILGATFVENNEPRSRQARVEERTALALPARGDANAQTGARKAQAAQGG